MKAWVRLILWAIADICRHPIANVRNFRGAFKQGLELGRQGYTFDVEERAFKRTVGVFRRREDGTWEFEEK